MRGGAKVARDLALVEHGPPDVRRDPRRLPAHVVLDLRVETRHVPPHLHERRIGIDRILERTDVGVQRPEGRWRTRRIAARQAAAPDGRTDDHQPVDPLRPERRQGLGDHATQRMPRDVGFLQTESVHEQLGVVGEVKPRVAARGLVGFAVATLVEEEHAMVLGEQMAERQVAERTVGESVQEDDRRLGRIAQLHVPHAHAVGERDGLALRAPGTRLPGRRCLRRRSRPHREQRSDAPRCDLGYLVHLQPPFFSRP